MSKPTIVHTNVDSKTTVEQTQMDLSAYTGNLKQEIEALIASIKDGELNVKAPKWTEIPDNKFLAVIELIKHNYPIKKLAFSSYVICTDLQIELLTQSLISNQTIKAIDFGCAPNPQMRGPYYGVTTVMYNIGPISDNNMRKIANLIEKNTNLESIEFDGCIISPSSACFFAQALKKSKLKSLNLSACQLDTQGVISIINALINHAQLERLDLYNNATRQDPTAIKLICELIEKNKALKDLNIGYNGLYNAVEEIEKIKNEKNKALTLEHINNNIAPAPALFQWNASTTSAASSTASSASPAVADMLEQQRRMQELQQVMDLMKLLEQKVNSLKK